MEFLLKTWRRSKSRAIKTPVSPLPSLKKIKRLVELLHTIDTHAKIKTKKQIICTTLRAMQRDTVSVQIQHAQNTHKHLPAVNQQRRVKFLETFSERPHRHEKIHKLGCCWHYICWCSDEKLKLCNRLSFSVILEKNLTF